MLVAVIVELGVFYVAHVYADVLGERYDHPELRLGDRFGHACRHDLILLLGGLPIIAIFAVERAAGVGLDISADTALIAPIVLLGGFGFYTARRARAPFRSALGEGLFAALIGVAVLVLKLLLK